MAKRVNRKMLFVGVVVVASVAGFLGVRTGSSALSPFERVTYAQDGLEITVEYSRPYKKGREIFGELVPYGEVWRTGANEATTFSVNEPIRFGGKRVKPGTYALFTIPEEETWTVILSKATDQWGAFDYDRSQDALRVDVPVQTANKVLEQFTISFQESGDAVDLEFKWDTTRVAVEIAPVESSTATPTSTA